DENVLVGIEGFEDAGIYRITDEIALVQTIDFFTPIVDDPYRFGQIAAANSLSDIYAMGAIPKTALNIVCFSPKKYDLKILKEIIRGGADKIREAGVSLLGGHSVEDEEIKYGLSVTGLVHPSQIILNSGAKPDDLLILTKPLGTGILSTAVKGKELSVAALDHLISVMAQLNKSASEAMHSLRVHAATDVTGFGLAGHLTEMIRDSIGVELYRDKIPYFKEAVEFASTGFLPGGLYKNRDFYRSHVTSSREDFFYDLIFDPQTSGGLLIALDQGDREMFAEKANDLQLEYWTIGKFIAQPEGKIVLI
ncbi:MAG TPA: selenide, water dikinase SelD, partial [Syntrophorhabdaceae bacterium]|nr:selenide, water dikinase SelD [Syntrophorhabdaceae bacterium]